MNALRDRDVPTGAPIGEVAGSTLTRLITRARDAPLRPPLLARRTRATLLHEAAVAGARRRAKGGDVIELVADFQVSRAVVRDRLRRPADSRNGAGSPRLDARADVLVDAVLVAIVRGYEGGLESERSSTTRAAGGIAGLRAATHSTRSS